MKRHPITPFGAGANQPRCPLCGSVDLLPMAPTAASANDSYCAHCPWESRKKSPAAGRMTPRAIGGSQAPAPIYAASHLANRERDRRRARGEPDEPAPTTPAPKPDQSHLTKPERLQVAGVVVLGITCLVGLASAAFL